MSTMSPVNEKNDFLIPYFAYGSNMLKKRLEDRVGFVVCKGKATLENYHFSFNKLGMDGTGKANIVPETGSTVSGVLYELTQSQVEILDTYEGTPTHYERKWVIVDGTQAVTYIATPEYTSKTQLKPSPEYLSLITQGALVNHIDLKIYVISKV